MTLIYVCYNKKGIKMDTLIDKYNELQGNYALKSQGWFQFVQDHYNELKQSATLQTISPEIMYQYRYSLESYLRHINKNINIAWIVLILNGLDSNMDFVDVKSILIPTDSALSDLYNSYINFKTAAAQIA